METKQNANPTIRRNTGLSHVRAISCIAVVILHTFFACFSFVGKDTIQYRSAVLIRNLMFWSVPCFVMVTGALLLDPSRNISYTKVFGKYIPRMLAALVVFSALFLLVDIGFGFTSWSRDTVPEFFKSLLTGQGQWSHMWYLYTMIGLYLIMPVLHAFVRVSDRKALGALTLIFFIFLSVVPILSTVTDLPFGIYIPVITIYPLYLVLGRFLVTDGLQTEETSGEKQKGRGRRTGLFSCLIVAFAIGISICTLIYLHKDNAMLREMVTDYSFPIIVLGAVGVFGLTESLGGHNKVLEFIDKHAFGIYLIHMVPLKILAVKKLFNPFDVGVWFVFVVAVGIFLISLLITYLLRLLPIVRKLL